MDKHVVGGAANFLGEPAGAGLLLECGFAFFTFCSIQIVSPFRPVSAFQNLWIAQSKKPP